MRCWERQTKRHYVHCWSNNFAGNAWRSLPHTEYSHMNKVSRFLPLILFLIAYFFRSLIVHCAKRFLLVTESICSNISVFYSVLWRVFCESFAVILFCVFHQIAPAVARVNRPKVKDSWLLFLNKVSRKANVPPRLWGLSEMIKTEREVGCYRRIKCHEKSLLVKQKSFPVCVWLWFCLTLKRKKKLSGIRYQGNWNGNATCVDAIIVRTRVLTNILWTPNKSAQCWGAHYRFPHEFFSSDCASVPFSYLL